MFVGWARIELATNSLKANCSTFELPTQNGTRWDRTINLQIRNLLLYPIELWFRIFCPRRDSNPQPISYEPNALTFELQGRNLLVNDIHLILPTNHHRDVIKRINLDSSILVIIILIVIQPTTKSPCCISCFNPVVVFIIPRCILW